LYGGKLKDVITPTKKGIKNVIYLFDNFNVNFFYKSSLELNFLF